MWQVCACVSVSLLLFVCVCVCAHVLSFVITLSSGLHARVGCCLIQYLSLSSESSNDTLAIVEQLGGLGRFPPV